jgi:hypothetical protein
MESDIESALSSHCVPSPTIALSTVSSFRASAMKATFGGFPASIILLAVLMMFGNALLSFVRLLNAAVRNATGEREGAE